MNEPSTQTVAMGRFILKPYRCLHCNRGFLGSDLDRQTGRIPGHSDEQGRTCPGSLCRAVRTLETRPTPPEAPPC